MVYRLSLMVALIMLCACGARAPALESPAIRIMELRLEGGRISASLRVRNPVAATLPAAGLAITIMLDDDELGRFTPDFDLNIPSLGNEVIEISTPARPQINERLRRLEAGELLRVSYQIDGDLALGEGKSALPISSRGWLSPTPGKPGSFR